MKSIGTLIFAILLIEGQYIRSKMFLKRVRNGKIESTMSEIEVKVFYSIKPFTGYCFLSTTHKWCNR